MSAWFTIKKYMGMEMRGSHPSRGILMGMRTKLLKLMHMGWDGNGNSSDENENAYY